MTGDPNKFIKLRKYNKGRVTFGDNMTSKIIGKGCCQQKDQRRKFITGRKPQA